MFFSGLIYMLIKRAVDKYNLVFVYDTEIADKSVHRLAGNFIIVALIIQQLTLLFFILVRAGRKNRKTKKRIFLFSLETLTFLSMTLIASFILTSRNFPQRCFVFHRFEFVFRWGLSRIFVFRLLWSMAISTTFIFN